MQLLGLRTSPRDRSRFADGSAPRAIDERQLRASLLLILLLCAAILSVALTTRLVHRAEPGWQQPVGWHQTDAGWHDRTR